MASILIMTGDDLYTLIFFLLSTFSLGPRFFFMQAMKDNVVAETGLIKVTVRINSSK